MSIPAPIIETNDPAIIGAWYALFLAQCPEFTNVTLYPVAMVNAWIPSAVEQMNFDRFGTQYNLAVCLYVAHNVVLSARELAASQGGGSVVGEAYGPVASKSIDKLSVSYGTGGVADKAGSFNLTSYGQRLYKMIQTFGMGPFYVSGRRVIGRRR